MEEQSKHNRRSEDNTSYLKKLLDQAGPIVISLGVLGSALFWLTETKFQTKEDAAVFKENIQCQVTAQDKTSAVTNERLTNIEKTLSRIEAKLP